MRFFPLVAGLVLPIANGVWQLVEPLVLTVPATVLGTPYDLRFVIPKGFMSDLTSGPRVLLAMFGITPDGLWRDAVLGHDWGYSHDGRLPPDLCEWVVNGVPVEGVYLPPFWFTRYQWDNAMRYWLSREPIAKWKRDGFYWAVRMFARKGW